MPINKVTTDYTGRDKDINIFPVVSPLLQPKQTVTPSFGKVSSYCAGVQKLLQRYAVALLTVQGSQPEYPTFGTGLLRNVMVSSITTLSDLSHAFNFANSLVISMFRDYQSKHEGLPLDEQLDTAILADITTTANYEVTFSVKIYTMAGNTYDYLLPIPTK